MLGGVAAMLLAAAPAPAGTVQAQFDAADAAAGRGDWAGALAGYDALDRKLTNRRTKAIVALRRGEALTMLDRRDEGRAAMKAGLAALGDAPVDAGLRASGLTLLGEQHELAFDFAAARDAFATAQALATTEADRARASGGLTRTLVVLDPAAAVREADAQLARLGSDKAANASRAGWLNLKGRAQLNAGDPAAASATLLRASALLGGLSMKVDRSDLIARSDRAIAALRAGRREDARRYLAYTGAGNAQDAGLVRPSQWTLPPCGGEGGETLRPEDVVVVQLAIRADGRVDSVQPVYASRPGAMVVPFLRAVADWEWSAELLAKVSPLFRSAVRLELRCSTAVARPPVLALLEPGRDAWLKARGVAPLPALPGGAEAPSALPPLRAELARREGAGDPVALLPVLLALAEHPLVDADETRVLAERGVRLARTAGAPGEVVLPLRMLALPSRLRRGQAAQVVTALADEPDIAASPRAWAAALLLATDRSGDAGRSAKARLAAVADDARLGARDPLKVGALIRLANLAAQDRDMAAAQASFEWSGLTAAQCALVDASPAVTQSGLSSADFPQEAMRWGFEGWVQMEMDVDPAGRSVNRRPVIAYPPFVFGDPTTAAMAKTRFTQSYRPGGTLGCTGKTLSVNYRLP